MDNKKHILWSEKYRPKTLDEYVFNDKSHEKSFRQMVKNKSIPHLLLSGVQGSGKSTIAEILLNELDIDPLDVKVINASDENSVDTMREKIKNFISTYPVGDFKVVRLEEADYLSMSAQAVLRKYMEETNSTARFILTCNYENKIMPALKSRSQHFRFKAASMQKVTEYVATILYKEKVKTDLDTLDKYVAVGYPDIRKIVNLLQQNTVEGVLIPPNTTEDSSDYKFKLLDLISEDDWDGAREIVCKNVTTEEWEDLYRFLYDNLDKSKKFSDKQMWKNGILVISDYIYKHAISADPEINAAGMFIKLSNI